MMVIGIGSSWAADETITFSQLNYSNAETIESVKGEGFTITFDKGSTSYAPTYYNTGTAIRAYAGNTVKVSSEKAIEKIEFTFGSGDNTNAITADVGTWSEPIWTGNATSVTFTIEGQSKHRRIASIAVTFATGDVQKTATIVEYTGDATTYEVKLGEAFTAAKFVVSTVDQTGLYDAVLTYESSNPDVAEVDEAGNVTINGAGEATITATYAGDDTYYGSHASFTIKVTDPDAVPVASLEEAFEAATATAQDIYFDFTGLQITAVTETNAYLQDANGFGAMIYNKAGHGYQEGQVLNGTANCQFVLYRGALEFTGVTSETVPVEVTPEMQEVHQFYVTVGDLAAYNHGSFIKLENMTYTGQTANGNNINYNFTDATGAEFILFNTFKITMPELTEGATYTLNGIFVVFNETLEIAPRNADDIVINKQYPTYIVSGLESVTTNGEFPFTVYTRASGLKVELEKTKLAELIPGTVVGVYTLKTYGSEGDIILNISTEEDATYYPNEEPYNVHISFSQGGEEPQFEIEDGVFDFTVGEDYGSGRKTGSVAVNEDIWTAGNVTLTAAGRSAWFEATDGSVSMRVYKASSNDPAGSITISVPQGNIITGIVFEGANLNRLSADKGVVDNGKWVGTSQNVAFTVSDRVDITKITVTYGEGTEPVEPTEVTINVMNEDGTPMDEKIVMNVGETKNFTVYASNQAHVSYRGDNDEVATVEAATTLDGGIDGGIITAKAAGTMTITFTVDATSNQPSAEKKISVTVLDNAEPQFEIEDGVFDFTAGVDYGSGIKTTSDGGHYEETPSTWTAGNITLVADVKYRWWEKDATLRFYATGSMTFSAPAGYAITSIKSNVTLTGFTATDGELSGNTWTGEANAVTLTKEEGKSVNISNITVQYQKADTYTRDVAKGEYGTLCLPYKSYVSGATVYDIVGVVKDGDKLTDLGLEEHTGALEAGVAYVFHATSTQVVATLVGEAVKEAAQTVGLVGNLSAENIKTPDGCYVLVDGVLRQVQGGTAYIQTNRAYFDLSGVEAIEGEATAGVKYISISFEEDATGITELTEKTEAAEGAIYNLQGQRVNSLQRGINIVGGKKVLVK